MIALFHTGQTGVGSGMRGGMGMRLKYSNPMHFDDVAVDFPDMPIVLAHPSFPWTEEGLAVAQHKPNVYCDMSGWSPKYFPEIFVRYANSILKKKMLMDVLTSLSKVFCSEAGTTAADLGIQVLGGMAIFANTGSSRPGGTRVSPGSMKEPAASTPAP